MRGRRLAAAVLGATLAVAGCSSAGEDTATSAADVAGEPAPSPAETTAPSPGATGPRPLPPAPALPPAPTAGAEPTALTIGRLDVAEAPVRPVGVEGNGEMEIPGVSEVGWYRFGARPGEPGSTVLAAHIAYDGVDGVFRHLDDLGAGDTVRVTVSDGSTLGYVVTAVDQVSKTELPADVWARNGDPRLTLITCGGEFDSAAGRYEDNVVVSARPA